jgi:hypothetical protein
MLKQQTLKLLSVKSLKYGELVLHYETARQLTSKIHSLPLVTPISASANLRFGPMTDKDEVAKTLLASFDRNGCSSRFSY